MTKLSVNINKVAYLRNSRHLSFPDPLEAARVALQAGSPGITVHPRPDQRHIRPDDVYRLADLMKEHPRAEYNIEGNPFEGEFMQLVQAVKPTQATLVPDAPDVFTSNQGWQIAANRDRLHDIITQLHDTGCRVSLFMDADSTEWDGVAATGADRVELYTEPYAESFTITEHALGILPFAKAAYAARTEGLGINAGHDLSLKNLQYFLQQVPGVEEVSIGHALVAEALFQGLEKTIFAYLELIESC